MTEKYRELYELSKELLHRESERFNRMEDKASRYFTALLFLGGVYAFIGQVALKRYVPPETDLQKVLFGLGMLGLVLIFASWVSVFLTLKIQGTRKIPLQDRTFEIFDEHDFQTICKTFAKGNREALYENRRQGDKKSCRLEISYWLMLTTIVVLLVFFIVFIGCAWRSPQKEAKGWEKVRNPKQMVKIRTTQDRMSSPPSMIW